MTYSQRLEHCRPSFCGVDLSHSFEGRLGQRSAAPRVVRNAGRWCVVEFQLGELEVEKDTGDEVASGRNGDVVALLW